MISRESFVYYYMKKSGGRHDPNLLIDIMKAFEEYMPEEKKCDSSPDSMSRDWRDGWNSYRDELVRKLK